MAIHSSSIYYSAICMIISVCIFFCISFTIENYSLLHIHVPTIQYEEEFLFMNQSSLTYHIEQTEFYPHLPIQIHTRNRERFLKLENKTKKIILLGNTMFDDSTWSIKSLKNRTNSGNMSELACSFLNNQCEITNDITRFNQADAVVYHLRNYINRSNEILKHRHSSQRFIFALWESPMNSPDLRSYNKFFNWTMTYRFDSHIFASYYAEAAYHSKGDQWFKNTPSDYQENKVLYKNINITQKWGTAAALISNCGTQTSKRWSLILKLKQYIDITIFGRCGKPCPKGIGIDCRTYIAEHYYFLLSFENSYCQDYATEKLFSAIVLPAIPVVFGRVDYTRYIPESSYIDVRQFASIPELGKRLNQIRNNLTLYQEYFTWKQQFVWDGFIQYMTPLCDLCLRLHLDTTPNIIDNIHKWWFHKTCQPETKKYLYPH